ncbi:response regulator [Thalassotalea sp. LPB0316]|uniref:response regulator n=1 Tax=Thalassotalea sp. LPB0316 TaxID=2769490 RepID=UPI001867C6F5|nr:response regulator [Thalassotalea sp. LPB0316]QOL24780.1 response regulator [Thalassotalea sp. LPB0316]
MNKPNVLIIDDDQEYLNLLKVGLESQFEITLALNFEQVAELECDQQVFDIALVDEHVGQDHGSSWIAQQKQTHAIANSYVLYSGLANEEAILEGLACGADDFLAKPLSIKALCSKLSRLVAYQNKISAFEQQLQSKDKVINISMSQASKYGACMLLTSKLNHCNSINEIKDKVFSFLDNLDLHGCVAFYPVQSDPQYFHSLKGTCSPVEIEVLEILKTKPRLFRFGCRTIFNHHLVSLLILNLHDDDPDTDIYIDALASLIECIGARVAFLAYKDSLAQVQSQISSAVNTTKKMVEVSKYHQQEIMGEIVEKIGLSFHVLDLDEKQEEYLMKLVHDVLKKHSQDDMNFIEVTQLLDQVLTNVERIKQLDKYQEIQTPDDEFDDDELF